MDIKDILTIMDRFDQSSMTQLQLKTESVELNIQKTAVIGPSEALPSYPTPQVSIATPIIVEHKDPLEGALVIKSPLVGIYYESASSESPPFKKPGDPVKVGEVVCILEAMKVFNEIKSPWDGVITSILVSNQDIVEFDQPLMIIERT